MVKCAPERRGIGDGKCMFGLRAERGALGKVLHPLRENACPPERTFVCDVRSVQRQGTPEVRIPRLTIYGSKLRIGG